MAESVEIVRCLHHLSLLGCQVFLTDGTLLELLRCRELVHRELSFSTGQHIMLQESLAIAGVCKWQVKRDGILNSLLDARSQILACRFGLYHSNHLVCIKAKQIVQTLRLLYTMRFAKDDNTTIRQGELHTDILLRPASLLNDCRCDEAQLDILLG